MEIIEFIKEVDTQLFIALNGSHNTFTDQLMFLITGKLIWIPLYAIIIWLIIRKFRITGIYIVLFLVALIVLSDSGSVHLFKDVFKRFRPCHNLDLQNIVTIVNNKCGGTYGFISSHASNTFALAIFTTLLFKNRVFSIFIIYWALTVSYSRIYLGVHYPFDILGGALWGSGLAFAMYYLSNKVLKFSSP